MDRSTLAIPELGPALGRLVAPLPASVPSLSPVPLDDIRIALVTQVFELAGDARRWAREGDRELALATLNRAALETAWQVALGAVAQRAATAVSARLEVAALEARLPRRLARRLPLEQRDALAIASRLSRGAAPLTAALVALDQAAALARNDRAGDGVRRWQEALTAAARRLEAAWLALEEALHDEWLGWEREVQDLRAWRRPEWPLYVLAALLFGGAGYLGLVLGGYVDVPAPLRGIVEAVWARWN